MVDIVVVVAVVVVFVVIVDVIVVVDDVIVVVIIDLKGSLSTLENSGFCNLRITRTDRQTSTTFYRDG